MEWRPAGKVRKRKHCANIIEICQKPTTRHEPTYVSVRAHNNIQMKLIDSFSFNLSAAESLYGPFAHATKAGFFILRTVSNSFLYCCVSYPHLIHEIN